jgi:hypothetical protein
MGRPEEPVEGEEDGEGRRERPSERHEKENCDGAEAFLEEPNGREQQPRVGHARTLVNIKKLK